MRRRSGRPARGVRIADMEPDYSDITVKNPRIGKVMRLEEEDQRQSEIEKLRSQTDPAGAGIY